MDGDETFVVGLVVIKTGEKVGSNYERDTSIKLRQLENNQTKTGGITFEIKWNMTAVAVAAAVAAILREDVT